MIASRRGFLKVGAWASLAALAGCGGGNAMGPEPATAKGPPAGASPQPAPGPTPKKILILGGTGFLGPHLVEAARRRGHTLTLFTRGKTHPNLFPDIEKLKGDRDGDLKALEGRKWDAVIDTSGYVPRIVRASTELLKNAVDHYVFISTISVYADTSKPGIDETAKVATIADEKNEDVPANYGALKALCEKAAESVMPGRVANIRPGLIVGPDDPTDRFTYWPARIARGGEVLAPGDGSDPIQFIDARDLAEWTIHVVEERLTGIYNAVGPEGKLTMKELVDACVAESGSNAQITWASFDFLKQQKVEPWSDMPVWVPVADPEAAGMTSISRAKAMKAGLRFRPVRETVRDTLAWWKTLPEDRRAKLRAGLPPEREAQVLAELKKQPKKVGAIRTHTPRSLLALGG